VKRSTLTPESHEQAARHFAFVEALVDDVLARRVSPAEAVAAVRARPGWYHEHSGASWLAEQLLSRFDEADQEAMLADLAVFRADLNWSPRFVTHHLAVTHLTPAELAARCGGRVERSWLTGLCVEQTVRFSSRATGAAYLASARETTDPEPPAYSAVFLVTLVPSPDLVVDLFETLAIDAEDLREVPFGVVLPERRYAVGLTTPGGSRREIAWFGGLAKARRFVAERSERVEGLWVERLSDEAYARRLAEGGFPSRHPGGVVPEGPPWDL
jgi:hypothetical protein